MAGQNPTNGGNAHERPIGGNRPVMAQKVGELMARDPATIPGSAAVTVAARLMRERDIGDVLVTDEGALRGVLTDRDIALRAVAEELPEDTTAAEICSTDVVTCSSFDDVADALELMREHAVRRLPVVDRGRLVGVVSLGDLVIEQDQHSTLADISAAYPNT